VDIPLPPTVPTPSLIASLPTYKLPATEPQPDLPGEETEAAADTKPAPSDGKTAIQSGGREQGEQAVEAPSEAAPLSQGFLDYADAWLEAVTDGQVPGRRDHKCLFDGEMYLEHAMGLCTA
jgi:hypothetical protein